MAEVTERPGSFRSSSGIEKEAAEQAMGPSSDYAGISSELIDVRTAWSAVG